MYATRLKARRQDGATIITVLFLVTALAALGTFMWRTQVVTSRMTTTEWDSARALYAAESGVQWAAWRAWQGQTGNGTGLDGENGESWHLHLAGSDTAPLIPIDRVEPNPGLQGHCV